MKVKWAKKNWIKFNRPKVRRLKERQEGNDGSDDPIPDTGVGLIHPRSPLARHFVCMQLMGLRVFFFC